jgi:hypothetical protein
MFPDNQIVNEDDRSIFVTRKEYDQLIERFPLWMKIVSPKLIDKTWSLGGCLFTKCAGSGLATLINSIRKN